LDDKTTIEPAEEVAAIQVLDGHFPNSDGREPVACRSTRAKKDHEILPAQLDSAPPPHPPHAKMFCATWTGNWLETSGISLLGKLPILKTKSAAGRNRAPTIANCCSQAKYHLTERIFFILSGREKAYKIRF
jgi:hypothetical protein